MTTNRYSMMDAFTSEEFSILYDLVMFHDECPEWMDAGIYKTVLEKVSDVMTEYNKGAAWWLLSLYKLPKFDLILMT